MSGIASGYSLAPSMNSNSLSSIGLAQPSTGSFSTSAGASSKKSGGGFLNTFTSIANGIGSLAQGAASIIGASKGTPVPSYYITPDLSAVGSYGVQNSMPGYYPQTQGIDFIDSYLAQSKAMQNATTNIGNGIGEQVSSTLDKYKIILIVGVVVIVGVMFFKGDK